VRVDTSDYSVNPVAIGARVDVTADLDHVRVRHGGRMVAEHVRRWARGMTVTDPAHVSAAAVLRQAYQHSAQHGYQHGGARTVASGLHALGIEGADEGMVRDLGDYDRAFGLQAQGQAGQS